jgi:hypothetical protein
MGQPAFAIDDFLSPAGQDQGVEILLLDKVPRCNFLFASFCGQGLCPLRFTLGYFQLIASAGIRIARQVEWARAAELVSVGASAFGAAVLVAPGAVVLGQRLPGAAWITG